jgi:hypothetical protein
MHKRLNIIASALLLIAFVISGLPGQKQASATVPGTNYLASKDASGNAANGISSAGIHSVSGDGRYVVFSSSATNLIPSDTNGSVSDVFRKDTQTGAVVLVSQSSSGVQSSSWSGSAAVSYDGRYVVFLGSGLVSTETSVVYLRDITSGTTIIASKTSAGVVGRADSPDLSADGRYVVFSSVDTTLTTPPAGSTVSVINSRQALIKDMLTGTLTKLSGNAIGDSIYPSMDCDGHTVAFVSGAWLGGGTPANYDASHNIYNVYFAQIDGTSSHLTYATSMSSFSKAPAQISCNGNVVAYTDSPDVRTYDRLTKAYKTASVSTGGTNTNQTVGNTVASISDDGRYVAYAAKATNLDSSHAQTYKGSNYDIYVRDTKANTTQLVSFTALGYYSGLVPLPYVSTDTVPVSISPDGSTIALVYATPNSTNTNGEFISGLDTGQNDVYTSKTGF